MVLTTPLLISIASAQDLVKCNCSAVEKLISFNASATREIPAFHVTGEQPPDNSSGIGNSIYRTRVEEDPNKKWKLIYRIRKGNWSYTGEKKGDVVTAWGTLMLDVGASDDTNIHNCHVVYPPQTNHRQYQWTKKKASE